MNRTPRKTAVKANALTNARPRRVSVCRAGANQSPINRAKSESVVVEKKELDTMLTSMKAQGYDIAGVAFTGEAWTRAAVDGWMSGGGYSDFTVEGEDGAYTVKSNTEVPEGAETRTVNTNDGIAVLLVKAPAAEDASTDNVVDPAEGAASDVQPVATKSALDVAFEEIVARAKAAGVPEERVKSLYSISSLADLIRSLRWLVYDLTSDVVYGDSNAGDPGREAVIADLKAVGQQLLTTLSALVNVEVADMAETFKSAPQEDTMADAAKTEVGTAPIVDTPTETIAPAVGADAVAPEAKDEPKADEPKVEGDAAPVAEPVADAAKTEEPAAPAADAPPAWFADFANTITTSVKSLTERVDGLDASKDAAKSADPVSTTVEVPAQKSEAAPEANSGSTAQSAEKAEQSKRFEDARFKAALGL